MRAHVTPRHNLCNVIMSPQNASSVWLVRTRPVGTLAQTRSAKHGWPSVRAIDLPIVCVCVCVPVLQRLNTACRPRCGILYDNESCFEAESYALYSCLADDADSIMV